MTKSEQRAAKMLSHPEIQEAAERFREAMRNAQPIGEDTAVYEAFGRAMVAAYVVGMEDAIALVELVKGVR